MPLFNFTLTPLEKVQPWGEPGDLSLSWFGLTDGRYWLETSGAKLFEYHPDTDLELDGTRYVDYQVSRLYEDILDIVPSVLKPIPESLQKEISGEGYAGFSCAYSAWHALDRDDEAFWEIAEAAVTLVKNRFVDSLYLKPGANIWLWSDGTNVHVEWDNRECLHKGKPAWSAQQGAYQLSRDAFIDEVRDFHNRLMQQMQERVDQVCAGALPPEVRIDLAALREEHERRSASIESLFTPPAEPTDWKAVERAIAEIKRPRAL